MDISFNNINIVLSQMYNNSLDVLSKEKRNLELVRFESFVCELGRLHVLIDILGH